MPTKGLQQVFEPVASTEFPQSTKPIASESKRDRSRLDLGWMDRRQTPQPDDGCVIRPIEGNSVRVVWMPLKIGEYVPVKAVSHHGIVVSASME
jgi:hypothetical protein